MRMLPIQGRVLLVDDNLESAELLKMLFDIDGLETRIASTGIEALRISEQFLPHVVITDVLMPGMNGMELAKHMRHQQSQRHVFIIAVSGWNEEKFSELQDLFDLRFPKPFDFETLRESVHKFLRSAAD
jgi:CheY-like chemotaxis protein